MTAFDHLEAELRAGVVRTHRVANPTRPWRRPTALALVAALVMAAGTLAATGTIRIGKTHQDDPTSRPIPHLFAGVRAGPAKTLPLRVADPAGGPPWTLRVFGSSRGGHCVQVGQVVRGHFGVFVPPGTLEPLEAWPGGSSSLCSGLARNGFPVVRGLESTRIVGGMSDPRRCPARPHGDCPISSVTLLRYGLLGPGARRVRLVDAAGRTLAVTRTSARMGGAYLFAISQPTALYMAADRSQRVSEASVEAAVQRARAQGVPEAEAVQQAMRSQLRPVFARPPRVTVIATFADGRTLHAAGYHRSPGPLPGLGPRARSHRPASLPHHLPVSVQITHPGKFAVVTLSFTAPRAISRFDVHYTQTLHGPIGRTCTPAGDGVGATTRDVARGQTVTFTLRRPASLRENGRQGWCRGRFRGSIRYSTPGRHITIGRFTFRIR